MEIIEEKVVTVILVGGPSKGANSLHFLLNFYEITQFSLQFTNSFLHFA